MPRAVNDGLSIYYEPGGRTDAETVVFVEGFASGRWMWRWQEPALASSFETLLWDNRGTGRSDDPDCPATVPGLFYRQWVRLWAGCLSLFAPPAAPFALGAAPDGPPTMSDLAADLEAVLADHGVESAHVVGASMGGMVAQQYALEYDRAKTLTLMCTTPGGPDAVDTPRAVRRELFASSAARSGREAIRRRMAPALSRGFREANPELVERIVDWRLDGDASRRGELAQACAVASFDASDRLDRLDLPTLVVHGTADRVVPAENARLLADRLPDAELELVAGGSHLFFVERFETVNRTLLEFLRTHTDGPQ